MSGSNEDNRRHPQSTFEAQYPYNQSTITRGGHEIHINDTPDKESLRIAHTKGSYVEIDKKGRTTINSVGKAYYYFCDGFTTTVDGNYDLKVKGVMNFNVDGSISDTTAGNRYVNSKGNLVVGVGKSLKEEVVGDKYENVGGVHSVTVDESQYTTVKGDSVTQIKGAKNDILEKNWAVTSGQNIEIISAGVIRFKCKNFIVDAESITLNTSAGSVTIDSASQIVTNSVGQTIINASKIILNG